MSLSLSLAVLVSINVSLSVSLCVGVWGLINVSRWQQVQALPKYTGTLVQRLIKVIPNPHCYRWTVCE